MTLMLETDRLQLVPFTAGDVELLHRIFTNPFVKEYLWYNETIPMSKTEEIIESNEVHFKQDNWGLWKIQQKEDNAVMGFAGLWLFFDEPQPQLLYSLLPEYTGKGYATEAAAGIIHYAFNTLHFSYLIASYDTPNAASRKVCERLHMKWMEEKMINDMPVTFHRIERQQ